jgi:hypothetical protein
MGCDIHICTEIEKDNKWHIADKIKLIEEEWQSDLYLHAPFYVEKEIYEGRNYNLFSILAGVRGWSPPPIPPRGFPDDLSDEVQEMVDFNFEHTACWLSLKDLQSIKWYRQSDKAHLRHFFEQRGNRSYNTTMNKLKRIQKNNKLKPEQVRIVFWFDS